MAVLTLLDSTKILQQLQLPLSNHNISTDVIGQGAYGIVYKGKKEDTNETVAIKRIPFADTTPEGGVPCNVIREISLLRELDHPNVVRMYVEML